MAQIAVLYPGAMGRALSEALAPLDHSLISYVAERGTRTQENAHRVGMRAMCSFEEMVDTAEVVVSVVPPDAASAVARRYAAALARSSSWSRVNRRPLFVDTNSVAPSTVIASDKLIGSAGGRFVDGVFLGPSTPISPRTLLMLSGPDAPAAAEIFGPAVTTRSIGSTIGHASAVKMGIALMTKALTALFLEMACAAGKAECLDATLEVMRRLYPGTMEFVERNLPTYPTHATRRIVEMKDAQLWLAELGQLGAMTQAATDVLELVSSVGLKGATGTFDPLLRHIVALEPLAKRT
jgi:3-hydroxyisobutyrate dehydrogenase-like beta-hydroxyacid dehydrogenase